MTHTVAILTGASRGIGAAMARQLAKPGTRLITLARRGIPSWPRTRAPRTRSWSSWPWTCPTCAPPNRPPNGSAPLPRDAKRYLLINNAGTVHPVSGTDALIDGQAIASAFNLNVTAVMLLTARFLAAVEDLPADRRVLNISSGAGRNPNAGWGVYCATKAALDMYRAWSSRNRARPARASSLAGARHRRHRHAGRDPLQRPGAFPRAVQFQEFHATGKLSSPANVATRILAYLDRDDFGTAEIDDIRNYD